MQPAFDTTFAQRLAKIDLSQVMARVQKETGLDDATLARAEALYRQFLTVAHKNPETRMVPPVLADHVWDAHLKFTRQYAQDCEMLFGHFMHHEPHDEAQSADYESNTIPAFAKEFGVDLRQAMRLNPEHFAAAWCGN